MGDYPFSHITCNGTPVAIRDLAAGSVSPASAFEASLFSFIRLWLDGTRDFPMTTSGSTGPPKPIVITRDQMVASALLTARALGLRAGQKALLCLSPEYIAGKMMVVRSFVTGMALEAVTPSSTPLNTTAPTADLAAMVPLQVHDTLHAAHRHRLDLIGTLIIGGGPVDNTLAQALQPRRTRCYATYGMTETVSHVALRQLNGAGAAPHYEALDGITFGTDDRGCLVVHWPALPAPVVTNDLVEWIDATRFTWLGRWDNLINTGGRKIIPEQLETVICTCMKHLGSTPRLFISSVPDVRLGNKIVLVMEGTHTGQYHRELLEALRQSLQPFEIPRLILSCPAFVETATGKVNRIATLELAIRQGNSSD